MNLVFANQNEVDSIHPLTTRVIVKAQQNDKDLINKAEKEGYSTQLVKNINVLCKDGKMVIPKSLPQCAVAWFYRYLQQPRTKCLEKNSSHFNVLERS